MARPQVRGDQAFPGQLRFMESLNNNKGQSVLSVRMKLRIQVAFLITAAIILVLATSTGAQAQTYTQYTIQLKSDTSAAWTIKQVSGINGTADTFAGFQNRITNLVNAAASQTGRPMSIDNASLQMSSAVLTEDSMTTQYMFTWLNFSQTQNSQLNVGDVFAVPGFFNQLYGDGALQINYPTSYTVKSVTPIPDQEDTSTQTLQWLGTQFFVTENPRIILQPERQTVATSGQPYVLIATGTAGTIAGVAGGLMFANRRKIRKKREIASPSPILFETQEEKVLRVLRSNGGRAYQSTIIEQCKFSKTKTSELLSALEKKGIVQRYKKGRDKIVNLNEQARSKNIALTEINQNMVNHSQHDS